MEPPLRAASRPPAGSLPGETSLPGVFAAGDVRHGSVKGSPPPWEMARPSSGPAPPSGRPGHRTGREVLTHVDAPGAERFGDILLRVYWLSDWLLSQRLKELEAEGLVTRTVVPATPVQSRHARSGRGRDLIVALQPLVKWGNAATH
jgi:DNA-binding HxlR family transcriptional regulator